MASIWKFEVPIRGTVTMPVGARLLDVRVQDEAPYVWAIVDPGAKVEERKLSIIGTGHDAPDGEYVGTFSVDDALGPGQPFVGHVFDEGPA